MAVLCGLVIGLSLALVGEEQGARAQPAMLVDSLDAVLGDPRLDGITVAVTVRSAETGELVYDRQGDLRLPPASNEKLITSAAALADLGPEFRFRTTVLASAPPRNGVLAGELYVRGGGDPSLDADRMDELAAAVAAAGVSDVDGAVVADDSLFDTVRLGTDWSWQDETFAYAAPISALSLAPDPDLNTGSVQVDVLPGATPGAPAQVGLTPPTRAVQLDNHILTGSPDATRSLSGEREHGTNRIVLRGTIPLRARPAHPLFSVQDPALYAADVFSMALARHGVHVHDPALRRSPTPESAVELAHTDSRPLAQVLFPLLKLSNNPMAEMLVKTMGARDAGVGSWSAGLGVAARVLSAEGVDPRRVQLIDGSGLSTSNLIAPDDLTMFLVDVQREPWFAPWYAALPIAGVPDRAVGGTLADRMAGTPAAGNVHAKTGTLATTSALSGYVTTQSGERLVFSVLESGFVGDPPHAVEDQLAMILASSDADGAEAK